jgi:hypothetical protein
LHCDKIRVKLVGFKNRKKYSFFVKPTNLALISPLLLLRQN